MLINKAIKSTLAEIMKRPVIHLMSTFSLVIVVSCAYLLLLSYFNYQQVEPNIQTSSTYQAHISSTISNTQMEEVYTQLVETPYVTHVEALDPELGNTLTFQLSSEISSIQKEATIESLSLIPYILTIDFAKVQENPSQKGTPISVILLTLMITLVSTMTISICFAYIREKNRKESLSIQALIGCSESQMILPALIESFIHSFVAIAISFFGINYLLSTESPLYEQFIQHYETTQLSYAYLGLILMATLFFSLINLIGTLKNSRQIQIT